MRKPRLIYGNDSRHNYLYRYKAPMSLHRLRQPVDEILGTSVDTLCFGTISDSTPPPGRKGGLHWDMEEKNLVMWWQAGENLKQTLKSGIDPFKIVVDRAHEKGIQVFSTLNWEQPDPKSGVYADYSLPDIRRQRLEIIEDVFDYYGLDGLQLNYYVPSVTYSAFLPTTTQASRNSFALTDFFRDVRSLLDRIGGKRGGQISLGATVHPLKEANDAAALDVRTILSENIVDWVVAYEDHPNDLQYSVLLDTNPALDWLVDVARKAGVWVYSPISNIPYDTRYYRTTVEMYRAAASNLRAVGADGLYLHSLPWPHTETQYQVLREMGDPDIYTRKTKHYFPGQKAATPGPFATERHLPMKLDEGVSARVPIFVGEDLDAARKDGELEQMILGVRIVESCQYDRFRYRFNDWELSQESAQCENYYSGIVSYMGQRGGLPERIMTYDWMEFDLPLDLVRRGKNEVEVTMDYHFRDMTSKRILQQVELRVVYNEPPAPIDLRSPI